MNGEQPRCDACICFQADETKLGREGNCLRHPPQIVAVTAKTLQGTGLVPGAMFPRVGAQWMCFEFRAKPAATVPEGDNKAN